MLKHFEGNTPAKIPKMQTRLNRVPTTGFRQKRVSCIGEVDTSTAMIRKSPRREIAKHSVAVRL